MTLKYNYFTFCINTFTCILLNYHCAKMFLCCKKIQLLVKAVNEYVVSRDLDVEVRFDIIAINKEANDFHMEHIEEAFYYF